MGWGEQALIIEKEAEREQRRRQAGVMGLTPQIGEREPTHPGVLVLRPGRAPFDTEELAVCQTFFEYYKEGEEERDDKGVKVKCMGGKGGYAGLKEGQRPRMLRVRGDALVAEGIKGCSWCGQYTKWMLMEGNRNVSVAIVHCTRCEGVELSRRLQAYLSLVKRKPEDGAVGGYRGPLVKAAEEEGGDACEGEEVIGVGA